MKIKTIGSVTLTGILLSACGGAGVIAAFSYIAPIGGNFLSINRPVTFDVNFDNNNIAGDSSIKEGGAKITGISDFPLPQKCTDAVEDDILKTTLLIFDNQNFTAYLDTDQETACLKGEYLDIHKIKISPVTTDYDSDAALLTYREPINDDNGNKDHLIISEGAWVNVDNADHWYTLDFANNDVRSDGSLIKGCETKKDINQQNGVATDMWIYNSPYDPVHGDRQNTMPHLTQAGGGNKTANFYGFSLIEVSENGHVIERLERVKKEGKYVTSCS